MATLGTFTAGQVLTAAELNAIGTGVSWTPTFNNLTLGNAFIDGRYWVLNELIFYRFELVFQSTTSVTGTVQFEYPVAAASTWRAAIGGQAFCDDANGGDVYGGLYRSTATTATVVALLASGTYVQPVSVSTTVPFTWATGDRLVVEDWYSPT